MFRDICYSISSIITHYTRLGVRNDRSKMMDSLLPPGKLPTFQEYIGPIITMHKPVHGEAYSIQLEVGDVLRIQTWTAFQPGMVKIDAIVVKSRDKRAIGKLIGGYYYEFRPLLDQDLELLGLLYV